MGKCFHLCCCCIMMNLRLAVPSTSTTSSSSSLVFEGSPDERARFYFSESPQSGSIAEAQIPIGQMWLCVFRTCKCQVSLLCGSQPTAGETGSSDNKPVPWSTGDWLNWICNLCAATSSTSAWLAVTVTRGLFICAVVGFFSSLHTFFFLKSIFIERTARLISPSYTLPPAWLPSASGRGGKCQAWSCRRAAEVLICLNSKNWITLTYALQWPWGGGSETATSWACFVFCDCVTGPVAGCEDALGLT